MNARRWWIVLAVFALIALGVLLFVSIYTNKNTDEDNAVETSTEEQSSVDHTQADPFPAEQDESSFVEFRTDVFEPVVLWINAENKLIVQDRKLVYTTHNGDQHVLFQWSDAYTAKAWRNGEYVLIGTQLMERGPKLEGPLGAWMVVHMAEPSPNIIYSDSNFFGPQEVLTVTLAKEPRLFVVTMINGESFSEYIFDPSKRMWVSIEKVFTDSILVNMPEKVDEVLHFSQTHVIQLSEKQTLYSFVDHVGSIVYTVVNDAGSEKYPNLPLQTKFRYNDYKLVDAKLMNFINGSTQILGKFLNQADEMIVSLISYRLDPIDQRIWEGDWTVLNYDTYIHASPDKLEIIQYEYDDNYTKRTPTYKSFPTNGAKLINTQGSLIEFERNGKPYFLSMYDVVNAKDSENDSLWSTPLQNYTLVLEKHEPDIYEVFSREILEWDFHENTNAPIPNELYQAQYEAIMEGDYGETKTYRQIGDQWFILSGRKLYEFKHGVFFQLGEVPISITVETGEAFSGHGAMDFDHVQDHWIIADTEGNRVIKLNDRFEIVAELELPSPYELTVEGDFLYISSMSNVIKATKNLEPIEFLPLPTATTTDMKPVEYGYWGPQEWYKDEVTGITWYYLLGYLYQYDESLQQYRSFYLGYNGNARATVKIIPYKDEILVMLDHRMERFDRTGNWLTRIEYPRTRPDGIYDTTPQGESSMILDEEAGAIYLVQGYRIVMIDLTHHVSRTIFHQDDSDIGELVLHNGNLYFLLHSNYDDRYYIDRYLAQLEDGPKKMLYTEVVQIELGTYKVQRFIVHDYYHSLEINTDAFQETTFTLHGYQ